MLRTFHAQLAVLVSLWLAGCGGPTPTTPEPIPTPNPSPTAAPSPSPSPLASPRLQVGAAAGELRSAGYALSIQVGGPLGATARSAEHQLSPTGSR